MTEISAENWKLCDEVFGFFVVGVEGIGAFSYSLRPDGGDGEHELDPNHPDVEYLMTIFEGTHEHVGGKRDGAECWFGYSADLSCLVKALEPEVGFKIVGISFHAPAREVPYVCLEGVYKGRTFVIDILSDPPEGLVSGMKVYQDGSIRYPDHMGPPPESDDQSEGTG